MKNFLIPTLIKRLAAKLVGENFFRRRKAETVLLIPEDYVNWSEGLKVIIDMMSGEKFKFLLNKITSSNGCYIFLVHH